MIIYNKTWLANLLVIDSVEQEQKEGLVPEDELQNVRNKYLVEFYSPNFFIRVGLFVLTAIVSAFSMGLFSLILSGADIIDTFGWLLFLGIANYIALEVTVQAKHHFRSGVDDALLYISAGLLAVAFGLMIDPGNTFHPGAISAFVLLLTSVLAIRFTDWLMALVAYLAGFATVFYAWQQIGSFGIATMPFVLLVLSFAIYKLVNSNLTNPKTLFYANCLTILQIAALVTLYLSANYFVVKELGDELNGTISKTIPLAWFFCGWTMALPFVYIVFGLKKKNTILLRTGLLLILAAAITFKNYHHVLPIEVTLIICGTLALAISYFVTRYLRTPKNGFIYQELNTVDLMDQLKIESLIISESFADTGAAPAANDEVFGGGHFGGGGATSSF